MWKQQQDNNAQIQQSYPLNNYNGCKSANNVHCGAFDVKIIQRCVVVTVTLCLPYGINCFQLISSDWDWDWDSDSNSTPLVSVDSSPLQSSLRHWCGPQQQPVIPSAASCLAQERLGASLYPLGFLSSCLLYSISSLFLPLKVNPDGFFIAHCVYLWWFRSQTSTRLIRSAEWSLAKGKEKRSIERVHKWSLSMGLLLKYFHLNSCNFHCLPSTGSKAVYRASKLSAESRLVQLDPALACEWILVRW